VFYCVSWAVSGNITAGTYRSVDIINSGVTIARTRGLVNQFNENFSNFGVPLKVEDGALIRIGSGFTGAPEFIGVTLYGWLEDIK